MRWRTSLGWAAAVAAAEALALASCSGSSRSVRHAEATMVGPSPVREEASPLPSPAAPAVAAVAAVAAVEPSPSPTVEPAASQAPEPSAPPVEVPQGPPVLSFRGRPVDPLLDEMAQRPVLTMMKKFVRAEPVYRLDLGDGLEIAFKPQTRPRPHLWKADVLGWELGRLLGLSDRVPPVTGRFVPLAMLSPTRVDNLQPSREQPGMVWGSAIYWMPVLDPPAKWINGEEGEVVWSRWMDQARKVPDDVQTLARDVSALILFDYLQANIDRFDHPSNLRADEAGRLVFRDNNEGWGKAMGALSINRRILELTQRFPHDLIARLREADAGALAVAIEPWAARGKPLLDPARLQHYEKRRQTVLKYIDRLLRKYGEERVLTF